MSASAVEPPVEWSGRRIKAGTDDKGNDIWFETVERSNSASRAAFYKTANKTAVTKGETIQAWHPAIRNKDWDTWNDTKRLKLYTAKLKSVWHDRYGASATSSSSHDAINLGDGNRSDDVEAAKKGKESEKAGAAKDSDNERTENAKPAEDGTEFEKAEAGNGSNDASEKAGAAKDRNNEGSENAKPAEDGGESKRPEAGDGSNDGSKKWLSAMGLKFYHDSPDLLKEFLRNWLILYHAMRKDFVSEDVLEGIYAFLHET